MKSGGGGGGGQPQQVQQVQKSDPWSGQQPFLTYGFEQAKGQFQGDKPTFFPGQTFAPTSPETELGLGMATNRAMQGSPALRAAEGNIAATAGGQFLGQGNPYYDAMVNRVQNTVTPMIDAKFSQGGRYGSVGHREALTRGVADATAPLLFNDYGQERQRMMGASGLAPQIAQAGYGDAMALGQVGAQREGIGQQQISEDVARFNYDQNLEANKLARYLQNIQGNYGGESLSTTTYPKQQGPGFFDYLGPLANVGTSGALMGKLFGWF